jgi:7-cyano-7-deazaguanine synthase in queuosine biosynthesis
VQKIQEKPFTAPGKILLLFSGGTDSAVLLKYMLENKVDVSVLHVHTGWSTYDQKKLKRQAEVVHNIINYYKKKYYAFPLYEATVKLDLSNLHPYLFAKDEQWCHFFAGIYCRHLNIKDIWVGTFTYITKDIEKTSKGTFNYWMYDGQMYEYINYGTRNDWYCRDIKIHCPMTDFKEQGIDSFETKKEAFLYLDPEVRTMVKSCHFSSDIEFCGECYKCQTDVAVGIRNDKGEIIV